MDLDDTFTEKLLERNRVRKEYLAAKKKDTPHTATKKRPALEEKELNLDAEVNEDSPKRQCFSPSDDEGDNQENMEVEESGKNSIFVPYFSASNKGLAALQRKDKPNNDYGNTEEVKAPETKQYMFSTPGSDICNNRQSRLANLASNINQWEDHSKPQKPDMKIKSPVKTNVGKYNVKGSSSNHGIPEEKLNALKSAQNLNRSFDPVELPISQRKALFEKALFNANENRDKMEVEPGLSVAQRARLFESAMKESNASKMPNPRPAKKFVEKSVSDMFEKCTSAKSPIKRVIEEKCAMIKSPVKTASPVKKFVCDDEKKSSGFKSPVKSTSPVKKCVGFKSPIKSASPVKKFECDEKKYAGFKSPVKSVSPVKKCVSTEEKKSVTMKSPMKVVSSPVKKLSGTEEKRSTDSVKSLGSNCPKSPKSNIAAQAELLQRQLVKGSIPSSSPPGKKTEISNLVNHWEKLSSSSQPPRSATINEMHPSTDSVPEDAENTVFESEPESELPEKSDSYSEFSESDFNPMRLGVPEDTMCSSDQSMYCSDVQQSDDSHYQSTLAREGQSRCSTEMPRQYSPITEEETTSNFDTPDTWELKVSETSDDYYSVDQSLATTVSDSFVNEKPSSMTSSVGSSCSVSSYDPESTVNSDGEPRHHDNDRGSGAPLLSTVSFYRRQMQNRTTPVRTIVRRPPVPNVTEEDEESGAELIQDKIRLLQEDVVKQQTIIGQTSQALNLCIATAEFSGSIEQIEGERLLLIATQKRQACLNEIQRLKTHGAQRAGFLDGTGSLIISDIQLPLKKEFIAAHLEGKLDDTVHWFLCLIRHGSQVIVTQMATTGEKFADGMLRFSNHIKIQQLPPDYSVVFEVYALQTKKESMSHDKKYHIKRDTSKVRLTPKVKKVEKLVRPTISSPGGPNAVRSPSFGVVGFTRFTIQNCNKNCFVLDKVPFVSPLDGILRVRLQLHAEHKVTERGFLTMFEDVSGFGAWQRRWCALHSDSLAYWKYPDDEQKKDPIGIISLEHCITEKVKLASWEICARPHTFQMVTIRQQQKGDSNTLISQTVNTLTTTKHLLSADTKEERIIWCSKLNEALTNLRKWNPNAMRPIQSVQK